MIGRAGARGQGAPGVLRICEGRFEDCNIAIQGQPRSNLSHFRGLVHGH